MDDIRDIKHWYETNAVLEDDRLQRHQLEYDMTQRYLQAYLPSGGHILEIGAASGKYTITLARNGYQVTAFDLSQRLTDIRRQSLLELGLEDRVMHIVGDARDLSELEGQRYSASLIMGPLYHLVYESDRQLVLKQVFDLLEPGGILVTAFISRYGILGDLMQNVPQWIEEVEEVRSVIEHGRDPEDWHEQGFRGYFATVYEIPPLHEGVGFETLVVAGVEPCISADDASYNQLSGNQRLAWLDLLYEISAEPSIVAASRHLLYIGRKPK